MLGFIKRGDRVENMVSIITKKIYIKKFKRGRIKMKGDVVYFTKQLLIEYNMAAIREKRNRALREDILEELEEEFIYPILSRMFHTKDEIRVEICFFNLGNAWLDMSVERYYMLPVARWNEELEAYEIEDEIKIRERFPYKNREWTEKVIKKPYRKQGKFRKEVLNAYDNTCAVCGIREPKVLRAAHIVPVVKGGSDDITNGLCLCTNHEIAYDRGLIKIKSDGKIEVMSNELKGIYDKIIYPKDKDVWPSEKYLREKYNMMKV